MLPNVSWLLRFNELRVFRILLAVESDFVCFDDAGGAGDDNFASAGE